MSYGEHRSSVSFVLCFKMHGSVRMPVRLIEASMDNSSQLLED
jgi:hypothetical protein